MDNYKINYFDGISVIDTQRDYTVAKSNILVLNSRYQYSLLQQKTLAYICAKIKPSTSVQSHPYQLEYIFEIAEYLRLVGVENSGYQYTEIKKTLQSLSDKSMWIPIEDENGKGEILVRWLTNVTMYQKKGLIKIKLDEYLIPYLFELQERYLSYGLNNILNFRSKYSIRFYEIFKAQYDLKRAISGKQKNETPVIIWTVSLDDLRHALMLDTAENKNKYKNFKDFRICILELVQREINELSDMKFDFDPITKGRKTIGIKFILQAKNGMERLDASVRNAELLGEE